jgi:hypothetical protein
VWLGCAGRSSTLDIVVALAVAAAPLMRALRPDISGVIAVEVAALTWVRLSTLTRYTRAQAGAGTPTTVAGLAPEPPGATPVAPPPGALVLRGLGMLAGRSARRLPEAQEKLRDGARQAGRHTGRLQRTWRKPPP